MKRAIFIIGLVWLSLFAYGESLFEMGLHGGAAALIARPEYVNNQAGLHIGAHCYYAYLSEDVYGFRTGLTLDRHNFGFGKRNYEDAYSTMDVEGEQMDIAYTFGRLREQYTEWSVGIPAQVALTFSPITIYAGAKAVFPLSAKWQQTVKEAALSVYYPAYDNRVEESYPLGASRNFEQSNSGKMNLPKVQWWASVELNYTIPVTTWAANSKSYIMVGVYFDYCINRWTPASSDAQSLMMLSDTRDGFPLQRVLTPVAEGNRQGVKLVNGGSIFDVGVKISYALSPFNRARLTKRACHCR